MCDIAILAMCIFSVIPTNLSVIARNCQKFTEEEYWSKEIKD